MARAAMDPAGFNRPSGIGSLSADSDGYNPETGAYWRGSVWPPIQCMVIKGLERAGFQGTADLAAEKYYRNFLEAYLAQGDITEFLIPEKPVMAGVPQFVGWGGVAPIQLLLENLFGLRVDAPEKAIHWRIHQMDRHGVGQLPLGEEEVGLVCEARPGPAAPADLTITSTGRFTLTVELPGGVWQREIEPGQTLWRVENR